MAERDGWFGGRVTFDFDGFKIPPSTGAFKLSPAKFEKSAEANQDGSMAVINKPKLVGCEISLRNAAGIDWAALMLQQGNITIVEETNSRTHLFTAGTLTGTPDIDISTGEVSGLKVEGSIYRVR